jgi:hypothetical protein
MDCESNATGAIRSLVESSRLRHAYAQRRYLELTKSFDANGIGLTCPINGGKDSKYLRGHEREWDRSAREIISRSLGHSRMAITKIYCG